MLDAWNKSPETFGFLVKGGTQSWAKSGRTMTKILDLVDTLDFDGPLAPAQLKRDFLAEALADKTPPSSSKELIPVANLVPMRAKPKAGTAGAARAAAQPAAPAPVPAQQVAATLRKVKTNPLVAVLMSVYASLFSCLFKNLPVLLTLAFLITGLVGFGAAITQPRLLVQLAVWTVTAAPVKLWTWSTEMVDDSLGTYLGIPKCRQSKCRPQPCRPVPCEPLWEDNMTSDDGLPLELYYPPEDIWDNEEEYDDEDVSGGTGRGRSHPPAPDAPAQWLAVALAVLTGWLAAALRAATSGGAAQG